MNLKIAIAIIVAMLFVMPFTHAVVGYKAYRHGRVSMNEEAIKRQGKLSFVLNGKVLTLRPEIVRNFQACASSCHARGY